MKKHYNGFSIHQNLNIIEEIKNQEHPIESIDECEKSESEIKLISKNKDEEKNIWFSKDV